MILILSDPKKDPHADAVGTELSDRGKEVRFYDPASYPLSSILTIEYKHQKLLPVLTWDDFELDLLKVTSVWYRRPGKFKISTALYPGEAEWIREECRHLFTALWNNLDSAFWISKPENVHRANLKLFQLRVANEIGFRIPSFIVTNNVSQAKSFINSIPGGVVVKTLAYPALNIDNAAATLYTHLVTKKDEEQLFSVRFGPTFLQEFIPKKMDIRVTVIGKLLFAVGIHSADFEEARTDLRRGQIYDMLHEPLELPKKIKTNCLNLVHRLGLQFGAIDLILTPEGKYVFLEINPNGQWLWIEEVTGIPLTKAMCDFLE